jgi:hypothetical protein
MRLNDGNAVAIRHVEIQHDDRGTKGGAGDLRIDVGRADHYKKVDASLWSGDIKASAFQIFKGGLFRSFDWSGNGAYRLHAHLMAGDLTYTRKKQRSNFRAPQLPRLTIQCGARPADRASSRRAGT